MIDITKRSDIFKRLESLQEDANPVFGKMTAQHMIEHLRFAIMFSNGRMPQKLYFPEEKAMAVKASIIYSDRELPIGFRSPMLGDEPPVLIYSGLDEAITGLKAELEVFDEYFVVNKNLKPMNPIVGELDHKEWLVFHNKHFLHHFKQFNLV